MRDSSRNSFLDLSKYFSRNSFSDSSNIPPNIHPTIPLGIASKIPLVISPRILSGTPPGIPRGFIPKLLTGSLQEYLLKFLQEFLAGFLQINLLGFLPRFLATGLNLLNRTRDIILYAKFRNAYSSLHLFLVAWVYEAIQPADEKFFIHLYLYKNLVDRLMQLLSSAHTNFDRDLVLSSSLPQPPRLNPVLHQRFLWRFFQGFHSIHDVECFLHGFLPGLIHGFLQVFLPGSFEGFFLGLLPELLQWFFQEFFPGFFSGISSIIRLVIHPKISSSILPTISS